MLNMKKKNNNAVAKSDKEELITALDIGSSHLRLLSGYVGPDKQIRIRGYKEIKSVGYSNGEINDIGKLAGSIASIVQQFQNEYGIEVKDVVTGVPGHVIQGENQQGNITVSSGQVTETDRNRAIENAAAGLQQLNRNDFVVIHKNPQNYSTESSENIVNPIGFYAKRLDVNVHFIGCKGLYKKNIEQAVSMISSNIHTKNVIYVGNAVSAAITENEKEIGVIQADIGGGTISFTVYDAGKQLISQGISDGGDYITNSIAREFAIPKQSAEELKLKYGIASPDIIPDDQKNYQLKVEVPTQFSNQTEEVTITLGELSAVIYRCLGSMFELLFQRITSHGKSFLKSLDIGAGVVLTGGTAMLRGIDTVLSDYINYYSQNPANEFLHCNSKVRIGVPVGLRMCDDIRIPNELRSSMAPGIAARPDQAVVFGLLRVAKFDNLEQYSNSRSRNDDSDEVGKGFLGNFKNWMKREL